MAKAKDTKTKAAKSDYQIVLAPIVSEKTSTNGQAGRCVTFKVHRKATKPEIKKAVESIFGVTVEAIRTANYVGKVKRVTGAMGRRSAYKKAHVTLVEGQTISVVEGI
jgi:large subunit ribosomal protein L23